MVVDTEAGSTASDLVLPPSEPNMPDDKQKDWRELCVAVTNEKDSTKLRSLIQELIEALDRGERTWRHTSPPPDVIDTHRRKSKVSWDSMRKRLIPSVASTVSLPDESRLDLDRVSSVEVTSEEKDYGIESALVLGETRGWRAATPGTQTIRLIFDQPQRLRRISLVFEENEMKRTQEFVLRWSLDGGRSFREIVRQQWNFSPPATIREGEQYQVELSGVTVLELMIVPDIGGRTARASLKSLRVS